MSNKNIYKVIILGDSAVGKTSLLHSFIDQKFNNSYKATIGADFMQTDILVQGKSINLVIWDTAGQQKFRSMGQAFYRNAACCVLVYDITNKKSFQSIQSWITTFMAQGDPKQPEIFPFILVGNKIDKQDQRRVQQSQIDQFLLKHPKIIHLTSSAKKRQGLQAIFEKVGLAAMQYLPQEIFHPMAIPSVNLSNKKSKNQKKVCC